MNEKKNWTSPEVTKYTRDSVEINSGGTPGVESLGNAKSASA